VRALQPARIPAHQYGRPRPDTVGDLALKTVNNKDAPEIKTNGTLLPL
jgi:hypothetical protein